MVNTTMVHVRVDQQIKEQATETLAMMGLSVSDAVRVFLMRVVVDKQMPFRLKLHAHVALASLTLPNCSMISKKTAANKRAPLPRAADYTKTFLKDWERLTRAGRYDRFHYARSALAIFYEQKRVNSGERRGPMAC